MYIYWLFYCYDFQLFFVVVELVSDNFLLLFLLFFCFVSWDGPVNPGHRSTPTRKKGWSHETWWNGGICWYCCCCCCRKVDESTGRPSLIRSFRWGGEFVFFLLWCVCSVHHLSSWMFEWITVWCRDCFFFFEILFSILFFEMTLVQSPFCKYLMTSTCLSLVYLFLECYEWWLTSSTPC